MGYVTGPGTQHNPNVPRNENDVPFGPSGTVAVTGDMKKMNARWIRAIYLKGYGVSLRVGIGFPIPILNDRILKYTLVKDKDIYTNIIDYSYDYPQGTGNSLGKVSYAELRSGQITFRGKTIPTSSLSSYKKAKEIALLLKQWISKGEFTLGKPVELLPNGFKGNYMTLAS